MDVVKMVTTKKEERLVIPISLEQKQQIEKYAKTEGISMSMAARIILAEFFEKDLQKMQVYSKEKKAG